MNEKTAGQSSSPKRTKMTLLEFIITANGSMLLGLVFFMLYALAERGRWEKE